MLTSGEPYRYAPERSTKERISRMHHVATGIRRKSGPPDGVLRQERVPRDRRARTDGKCAQGQRTASPSPGQLREVGQGTNRHPFGSPSHLAQTSIIVSPARQERPAARLAPVGLDPAKHVVAVARQVRARSSSRKLPGLEGFHQRRILFGKIWPPTLQIQSRGTNTQPLCHRTRRRPES